MSGGIEYDYAEQEKQAIAFILDELDPVLASSNPYRAQFEAINGYFRKHGDLSDKLKRRLMRLYEKLTDVNYSRYDN